MGGSGTRRDQRRKPGKTCQTDRKAKTAVKDRRWGNREAWRDIQSVGCTIGNTVRDGRETGLVRYFLSSLKPDAKRLGTAVRSHWSIENSQHWVLDIAFREDDRRQQARNGAANLATVRRLAVSLLRQDKTITRGAKAKRMVAALEPTYLLRVLKQAAFDA